jgi:hypothetical protein
MSDSQYTALLTSGNEVVRICNNGDVLWKGRLVESDDEFKAAMIDLRDVLVGASREPTL